MVQILLQNEDILHTLLVRFFKMFFNFRNCVLQKGNLFYCPIRKGVLVKLLIEYGERGEEREGGEGRGRGGEGRGGKRKEEGGKKSKSLARCWCGGESVCF